MTRTIEPGVLRRGVREDCVNAAPAPRAATVTTGPDAPFFRALIACRINPGSNCASKLDVGGATFEATQTAAAKTIAIGWTNQAKELEVMRNVDRAPEPTLQDIVATIRRLPTHLGQTEWPDPAPASETGDNVRTLSNAISAIESAMSALQELPSAPPSLEADAPLASRFDTAPQQSPAEIDVPSLVAAVSWPDEIAQDLAEAEISRPRRSARRPRKLRAAGAGAAEGFVMSDMALKDALRPLLRRWLDENLAIAFDTSLHDELKRTGLPRWKVRWHRNRWRRWNRHAR